MYCILISHGKLFCEFNHFPILAIVFFRFLEEIYPKALKYFCLLQWFFQLSKNGFNQHHLPFQQITSKWFSPVFKNLLTIVYEVKSEAWCHESCSSSKHQSWLYLGHNWPVVSTWLQFVLTVIVVMTMIWYTTSFRTF